jgi:hypothetical protein
MVPSDMTQAPTAIGMSWPFSVGPFAMDSTISTIPLVRVVGDRRALLADRGCSCWDARAHLRARNDASTTWAARGA